YKGANVVSIGKAGENVCLNAGIVNDHGRIAARSGLGAVMGSKKLKAICIRGRNKIEVKDKEFAIRLSKKYRDRISKALKNPVIKTVLKYAPKFALLFRWFKLKPFATPTMYVQLFHYYGTPYFYSIMANIGDTPLKNWKGYWKDYRGKEARKVSGPTYLKYKVKQFGCYNCPVQCGAILSVDELNIKETHRPEYETIAAMGALQLNSDILSIIDLNEFLNRHGMDSISAGNILSFTLECVEHGLLKKEDFKCQDYPEGFLPTWGDPTYYKQIIKMVVNREGIGDILADGVKKASEKIEGSAEFAMNFNGQEPAMHDSRYFRSLAMSYITDPTPGRHTAASVDFLLTGMVNKFLKGGEKIRSSKNPIKLGKNQAIAAKNHQWFNSLGFCEFSGWTGRYPVIEMIKAIFDWDITPDDLYTIGWRIQTLRQMFNAREGAIMHKATGRLLNKPPIEKGPNRKRRYDMKAMITSYYKNIGFGENGVPLKETLEKLNLDFAIKDLDIAKGDSTYP
ncbi:MAG: aldehyde ferredoxin oxidoreductase C-terminal domain-containing protein, partial [Promethearchaeota archaeon]